MSNSSGAPLGVVELAEFLSTTPERLEALKEDFEGWVLNVSFIEEWYKDRVDDGSYENGRLHLGVKGRGKRKSINLAPLDAVFDEIQDICGKVPRTARKYGETGPMEATGNVANRQLLLCNFIAPDQQYTIENLKWLAEKRWKTRQAGATPTAEFMLSAFRTQPPN
jgi:hypothetical protein